MKNTTISAFYFDEEHTKEELEHILTESRLLGDKHMVKARSHTDLAGFYYARGLAVRRKLLELGGE